MCSLCCWDHRANSILGWFSYSWHGGTNTDPGIELSWVTSGPLIELSWVTSGPLIGMSVCRPVHIPLGIFLSPCVVGSEYQFLWTSILCILSVATHPSTDTIERMQCPQISWLAESQHVWHCPYTCVYCMRLLCILCLPAGDTGLHVRASSVERRQ